MAILPSMGLETPTVGASRGTWGGTQNSNLTKLDGHNHTSGNGERVPTAGININADLSFGSLYGPKDLHAITFASIVASTVTSNKSFFVSDGTGGLTANELYWKNASGNNVKFTDGNSLNVAAFVGGITGDYSAVSASEAFDNGTKNYTFKDGSAHWAGLRAGSLVLSEKGTSGTSTITQAVPAGLAATYGVTWPAALPASNNHVSIDSAGQLLFGDGDRVKSFTALLAAGQSGSLWSIGSASNGYYAISTAASSLAVPIDLVVGDRLKTISFLVYGDGSADLTTTVYLTSSTMVGSSIGTATTTNQAASWSTVTINVTDTTIATLESVVIEFSVNAANIRIGNINATYDHP